MARVLYSTLIYSDNPFVLPLFHSNESRFNPLVRMIIWLYGRLWPPRYDRNRSFINTPEFTQVKLAPAIQFIVVGPVMTKDRDIDSAVEC